MAERVQIIACGTLEWDAGFDYMLEALRRLSERETNFLATIYGSGTLYPELCFSIRDLDLMTYATIQPLRALRWPQRGIYISSSHRVTSSESYLIDAINRGLNVVATNVDKRNMYFDARATCLYLYPPRSITALVEHLAAIMLTI